MLGRYRDIYYKVYGAHVKIFTRAINFETFDSDINKGFTLTLIIFVIFFIIVYKYELFSSCIIEKKLLSDSNQSSKTSVGM